MSKPAGISVLHADCEPDFAELTADMLEREDARFTVETTTSAGGALDLLSERKFDCIVSDYDLPQTNGLELLKTVREDYPELPFILYTGKGNEEVASEAISAGVTDYLRKQGRTDQYTILGNRILNAVESHRSRQALTERNRKLRKYERMVNTMQEAACIYDADGHFDIVNEYLADWYGTSRDELEGQQTNLVPHIREQGETDQYAELLAGNRQEIHGEVEGTFPGHGYAVLEYRLTALTIHGNIEGVVGVARDITEHKEREQELRRYKKVVETIDDGVYVVNEEGRFVMVNGAYAEMFGYDRDELLGADVSQVVDEDVVQQAQQLEAEMRRGATETPTIEAEFRTTDRDQASLEAKFALLSESDNETCRVGVVRDITERKARKQELQRQNERLEEFVSVVSHDLRNPLQVASGRVELLREDCESGHIEAVVQALDRMDTLIEDLLTLAREGDRVGEFEPVALADLVEDCWQNIAAPEAEIVADCDCVVRADRSRLQQLLENLLRNAVEHGGDDVTVTVGDLDEGFYVEDDGSGIPQEKADDMFEAGYSTSEEGTGFGLSIVKQVAEAHGWNVSAAEGSNGGARFEVTSVEFRAA